MTSSYKRFSLNRDTTFYAPRPSCFACYDTGIVTNGDALLNHYLPDYDAEIIDGKILRRCGSDLAVICHCTAAYEAQDYEAQTTRAGFRDSANVRTTESNGRHQEIGVIIDKDIVRDIHRKRKASWEATAQAMNSLRQQVKSGFKPQVPQYIGEVKEQLREVGNLLPSLD